MIKLIYRDKEGFRCTKWLPGTNAWAAMDWAFSQGFTPFSAKEIP